MWSSFRILLNNNVRNEDDLSYQINRQINYFDVVSCLIFINL
jgi:hypothetical protein